MRRGLKTKMRMRIEISNESRKGMQVMAEMKMWLSIRKIWIRKKMRMRMKIKIRMKVRTRRKRGREKKRG